MRLEDIESIKVFCDDAIGKNYYSVDELKQIWHRSTAQNQTYSLVLVDTKNRSRPIRGIRICFPPGQWAKGKGNQIRPDLWKVPIAETAYFQSLFVDENLRGQGWGPKLSQAAIQSLKTAGTRAVVCHSWVESPGDSSGRYLRSLGFETVIFHKEYWKDVDYLCTRDGNPCLCTAEEMILYL